MIANRFTTYKARYLVVVPFFVVGLLFVLVLTSGKTYAFNKNNLMSNYTFGNQSTMSTGDIQRFLNKYPNSCLKSRTDRLPTGYSSYGGKVLTATIIKRASNLWGVNPQVILATLEKESNLVTGGSGCASWRYWSAMGYNCPDAGAQHKYPALGIGGNGTCVQHQSNAGFSAQVNRGAWQLMFNRQRAEGNLNWNNDGNIPNYGFNTKGNRYQYKGARLIPYDGRATIDGGGVYMTNGATASLYTYTPHISGNQHFVSIFTNWFGSTQINKPYAWSLKNITYYTDSSLAKKITLDTNYAQPGQKIYVKLEAVNTGYASWSPGVVKVGTTEPHNSNSIFANSDWSGSHRPTTLQGATIEPAETGTFVFSVIAPTKIGSYSEYFNLVAEHKAWLTGSSIKVNLQVTNPTAASKTKHALTKGQSLRTGDVMLSQDKHSTLAVQNNGNVVLRTNFAQAYNIGVKGKNTSRLSMQYDGNLVAHNNSGKLVWDSNTNGNSGAYLKLQTDGNLVVYSSTGQALWNGRTSFWPVGTSYTSSHARHGVMYPGQSLKSINGKVELVMQNDGNLVLYAKGRHALWSTHTYNKGVAYLRFQTDGNLVLYKTNNKPAWNSNTNGKYGTQLKLNGDGNLVLYNSTGRGVWSSHTKGMASLIGYKDNLLTGQKMVVGDKLVAGNLRSYLSLQHDGNLVLYRADGRAVWNSHTNGKKANRLVVQHDGNLVLYRADGRAVWNSHTGGK